MSEHKPCPFCGTEIVAMQHVRKYYWVDCQVVGCEIGGPVRESAEEAWKAWDTRSGTKIEEARDLDRAEMVSLRIQNDIYRDLVNDLRRQIAEALTRHGNDTQTLLDLQAAIERTVELECMK